MTKIAYALNEEATAAAKAWMAIVDGEVTGLFETRAAARAAGKAVKFGEIELTVLAEPAAARAPGKEKAPAQRKLVITQHSTAVRPTKLVWHIADELQAQGITRRKDVLAECVNRGVAASTARTQYQAWFTVQKEMAAREAGK